MGVKPIFISDDLHPLDIQCIHGVLHVYIVRHIVGYNVMGFYIFPGPAHKPGMIAAQRFCAMPNGDIPIPNFSFALSKGDQGVVNDAISYFLKQGFSLCFGHKLLKYFCYKSFHTNYLRLFWEPPIKFFILRVIAYSYSLI